jgi:DNA-binding Lrp family transcriptional regulator
MYGKTTSSDILYELYKNSRISVAELSKKFKLSHYNMSMILEEFESKYGLYYTLMIDSKKLGFTGGRLVAIKFEKLPDIALLKKELKGDVFIQDAYLCKGDFDLLLYVVGLTAHEYSMWEWTLRALLSNYKVRFCSSELDAMQIGFFPISSNLIKRSILISDREKRVLKLLNDNSRIKIKDISKKMKLSHIQVVGTLNKLEDRGIIKHFSTLVQKPDKKIMSASLLNINPTMKYQLHLNKVINEMLKEDFTGSTSDYSVIATSSGMFHLALICNFENGEDYSNRGSNMWLRLCRDEEIRTQDALLTDVIIGKWPFHADRYDYYKKVMKILNLDENAYRKARESAKAGRLAEDYPTETDL